MSYNPCDGCGGEDCVCCSVFIERQADAERDPFDDFDDEYEGEDDWDGEEIEPNEDMDGDFDSGMASAGHGTTEDYDHWGTPIGEGYGG